MFLETLALYMNSTPKKKSNSVLLRLKFTGGSSRNSQDTGIGKNLLGLQSLMK